VIAQQCVHLPTLARVYLLLEELRVCELCYRAAMRQIKRLPTVQA
jgi:hypothetical protein